MSTQAELPKGHPMRDAWEAYRATDKYANTRNWALNPNHVDGSLWAAFIAGYAAAPPAEAPAERGDAVRWALNAAQDWIGHAPHGDNCYLDRSEVGGHPGNRCNCGKDGALTLVEEALAAAPAAPAEGDWDALHGMWRALVDAGGATTVARHGVERGSVEWAHAVTGGMLAIERHFHPERFDDYTAPRVTGGREEWTAAKPEKEGVYAVRGYSIGARYETAIVEVREFDNGFGCNLHLRNSEGDPDEWDEIARYSDKFQWKYLAPLPSEGASFEEVAALQAATGGADHG